MKGIDHPVDDAWVESAFASRYIATPIPKDRMPEKTIPAPVAYQLIRDMRQLDANPRLNLASFVTTWMEPEVEKLIAESQSVNIIDQEQYPSSADIQARCVSMLANLYHAPDASKDNSWGSATIGSSEAIMLAVLAMKKKWEAKRKQENKPFDNPNIVYGANVQVCWEKAGRYFDVEERMVKLTPEHFILTPEGAEKLCDENTIGVVAILGSTYTGEFEDVKGLDKVVEKLNKKHNWELGIHVDGASGGFVAPFVYPDLEWDFRLKNVVSINASGHKYGLVYPGVGWVIWRSKDFLPEAMVFHTKYLGSDQPNFTLNFSKSASMVIAQYYQFIRLGFEGYKKIMASLLNVSARLEEGLRKLEHFDIYSKKNTLPLVAFGLKQIKDPKSGKMVDRSYTCFDVADKIRMRGWILPAYSMAPDIQDITLLRAVIREDLSMAMVDELIADISRAIDWLDHHYIFNDSQLKAHDSRMFTHKDRHQAHAKKPKGKHNAGVC